jgi:pimeloyl-ACP methyl ester carboxylesterase
MMKMDIDPTEHGHFATVNDIEMYYVDHGEGDPLVMLHGGTGTALSNWNPYIPTLSQKFRVIAPDCRGHGRTNNPLGEWSYHLMADDIAALVMDLGLQKPSICGWSDGGQIALELAMRYPGLARAYIVGAVWKVFSASYLQSLRDWGFEGPGEVNTDQIQRATPEYVEVLREIHSPLGSEYWKQLINGISTMWLTPLNYADEDFRKISTTVLILIRDRDQFIPVEDAVAMYRLIPNSELAVVPNADHSLSLTRIDMFAAIVMEFLTRANSSTVSA